MLTKPRTLSQDELITIFNALLQSADIALAKAKNVLAHDICDAYISSANKHIALARRFTTSRSK